MKKPFYAQDFTKGQIFKLGKKTITKDEIIDFMIILYFGGEEGIRTLERR